MAEGVVMLDTINRYGTHLVMIMRGGRKAELQGWLDHFGLKREQLTMTAEDIDQETQMHYLTMAWVEPGIFPEWEKIAKREVVSIDEATLRSRR